MKYNLESWIIEQQCKLNDILAEADELAIQSEPIYHKAEGALTAFETVLGAMCVGNITGKVDNDIKWVETLNEEYDN